MKEFFVAAAGPTGNFLLVGLFTLIANSSIELAEHLRVWITANLAIGIFNLLPCYPLDGGRMVRAVLTPIVGIKRATNMCTTAGIIIGISVAVFSILSALLGHMLNLSLVTVGLFIFIAAYKERKASLFSSMQKSSGKRERIKKRPINEKRIAAGKDITVHEVLKQFSGSSYHTVTVLDENMDVIGSISENELIKALLKQGGKTKLGQLVKRRH
jgi:stage IV sporulation protein FB